MTKLKLVLFASLILSFAGCYSGTDDIEKRYVQVEIPGYAVEDYIDLLDAEDPDLRYLAVVNLIKKGVFKLDEQAGAKALEEKIKALFEDASPKVRAVAAHWAQWISVDSFEEALIKLAGDRSSAVRQDAVSALGKQFMGSRKTVEALVERCDDKSVLVRLQAVEELGKCKCQEGSLRKVITEKLLARLPEVRQPEELRILRTLGVVGEGPDLEAALLERLDSGDDKIVTEAVLALGAQRSPAAVGKLADLLKRDPEGKKEIIAALSAIDTPEAVQTLIGLLNTVDKELRSDVFMAIGETEGKAGMDELVRGFNEESQRIIKEIDSPVLEGIDTSLFDAIVEALKEKYVANREKDPKALIGELLKSGEEHEKMIGLYLLMEEGFQNHSAGNVGFDAADFLPQVETLVEDPSAIIRMWSLELMGLLGDPGALPVLGKAIDDPLFGIRMAAVKAQNEYLTTFVENPYLGYVTEMKGRFVPQTYTEEDKDFLVREALEESLAGLEPPGRTSRRRIKELSSPVPSDRLIAAALLARDKNEAALPVCFEFLENGTTGEQRMALEAVGRFTLVKENFIARLEDVRARLTDEALKEEAVKAVEKFRKEAEKENTDNSQ